MVRKEPWYKPDRFLYREMMDTLGRNQLIEVFFAKKLPMFLTVSVFMNNTYTKRI
jgi:hypothetical protein